jgi:hypothetical protein
VATYPLRPDTDFPEQKMRVYSVCCFDDGLVVPQVSLLEAGSDEEAIRTVRSMHCLKTRELWQRHRLVASFRAER